MKSYMDYMNEITDEMLFEGLLSYGLFSDNLPPVFTAAEFFEFYKTYASKGVFNRKSENGYVCYESMRNTGIPRMFGIPHPIKYAILCEEMKKSWDKIRQKFDDNTRNDPYKVSRIHIRKPDDGTLRDGLLSVGYEDTNEASTVIESINSSIFKMNAKDRIEDGDPLLEFAIGKKYIVKTDIAQCFPSVYTHAIAWALVGKAAAKLNRNNSGWFNRFDVACRKMRNGETHGVLIGPHASNVIVEILLTKVDERMRDKQYIFIRNVDDYTCYTRTHKEAENFLRDLAGELREYDFLINYKKTIIEELPKPFLNDWVSRLVEVSVYRSNEFVNVKTVKAYLDLAISLMETNGGNASALLYALKVLGGKKLTVDAKRFCVKRICHLAIIYPYLLRSIEKYVFDKFDVDSFALNDIEEFAKILYRDSIEDLSYEGVGFALYYAIKYGFKLPLNQDEIIKSGSCICKVLLLIYAKSNNDTTMEQELINEARNLNSSDFDQNWIFIYEALGENELIDEWKTMKKEGVSFICGPKF